MKIELISKEKAKDSIDEDEIRKVACAFWSVAYDHLY